MVSTTDSALAWRVHRFGKPAEALRLDRVSVRPPGPREATVRIEAVGLNFPDLLLCAGRYQERPEPPFVPGYEAAGVVEQVGRDSRFAEGERVIVIPELPDGAMQTRQTVPDAALYPVPESVGATIAAVLHIAYQTAHVALHRRAGLRGGEWVLVTGAAGGVGLATVELARAAGARVIAAAAGAKLPAVRAAGADVALDPGEDDLGTAVREATDGRGADVVVDVVGGELFDRVRRCVAFEGRLVLVGFTSGAVPSLPANHPLLRNYSVVGLHLALYRRAEPALLHRVHDELLELLAAGAIAPHIHRELPFDEAPAALELIAGRDVVGRVMLRTG